MSTVVIVGVGAVGERIALGLATSSLVRRVVLASRSEGRLAAAATVESAANCLIEPRVVDGRDSEQVAALLRAFDPQLVVHCASTQSQWALDCRDDLAAPAVRSAGLALRLPYRLPTLVALMKAVQEVGYPGPVANASFPDVTGPLLAAQRLSSTLGLGNVTMVSLRVRDVMQAELPTVPSDRCRVFIGAECRLDDELAYKGRPLELGAIKRSDSRRSAKAP